MDSTTKTVTLSITADDNTLERIRRVLALMERNSRVGHSAYVGMYLDGDGAARLHIDGWDMTDLWPQCDWAGSKGADLYLASATSYFTAQVRDVWRCGDHVDEQLTAALEAYDPPMPPMLEGETVGEYTDRLTGADGTGRVPYAEHRNRACSLGYHGECTDPEGVVCKCPCHREVKVSEVLDYLREECKAWGLDTDTEGCENPGLALASRIALAKMKQDQELQHLRAVAAHAHPNFDECESCDASPSFGHDCCQDCNIWELSQALARLADWEKADKPTATQQSLHKLRHVALQARRTALWQCRQCAYPFESPQCSNTYYCPVASLRTALDALDPSWGRWITVNDVLALEAGEPDA